MRSLQLIREYGEEFGTKGLVAELVFGSLALPMFMAIAAFGATALSPSVESTSRLDGSATSIAIAGERP